MRRKEEKKKGRNITEARKRAGLGDNAVII